MKTQDKLKALDSRFQTLDEFYGNVEDKNSYEGLMNNEGALHAYNREKALLLEIATYVKESGLSKEEYDSVKIKYPALDFWYDDCYELLVEETL
jgi:6-phosphogluconolactonase/glucosamine-6-phosphate isomerase/deaminase